MACSWHSKDFEDDKSVFSSTYACTKQSIELKWEGGLERKGEKCVAALITTILGFTGTQPTT
jgi:hypothetical protein